MPQPERLHKDARSMQKRPRLRQAETRSRASLDHLAPVITQLS
jgi:hypothetical protein